MSLNGDIIAATQVLPLPEQQTYTYFNTIKLQPKIRECNKESEQQNFSLTPDT